MLYFVKWADYDSSENTWEPLENLGNSPYAMAEFRKSLHHEVLSKWWNFIHVSDVSIIIYSHSRFELRSWLLFDDCACARA